MQYYGSGTSLAIVYSSSEVCGSKKKKKKKDAGSLQCSECALRLFVSATPFRCICRC